MGGRGSGGGRSGGGAAKKVPTGEGITDKNELINLYNSISGNSNLSVEQRVKAMHDIEERIKELNKHRIRILFHITYYTNIKEFFRKKTHRRNERKNSTISFRKRL